MLLYIAWAVTRSADRVETRNVAEQTTQQLGAVADPLLRLCETDPTIRERVGKACDDAAAGVVTVIERGQDGAAGATGAAGIAGRDGVDGAAGGVGPSGAPGAPGAAGTPGAAGVDGQPGAAGRDGVDGRDGRDGVDGATGLPGPPGAAGPACPDGTTLRPVTFADGQMGRGCVLDETTEANPGG